MEEAITKAKLKENFGIGIIIRTMRVKFLQLQQFMPNTYNIKVAESLALRWCVEVI